MKKKFLLCIMIIIVFAVLLIGYGYYNLKSNSVYYAKHTPHKEGTEPVLMMLVDNLYWVYNPDIDGIEYDFDGGNSIYNYNFKAEDIPFLSSYGGEIYSYGSNGFKTYKFDYHFNLISSRDRRNGKIDIKDVDIEEVKKEIYKIVQPVIDEQTKPLKNLQWLFDRVYRDKFN